MKRTTSVGISAFAIAVSLLSVELLVSPSAAVARPPMLLWRGNERLTETQRDALFRARKQWNQTNFNQRRALMRREKRCVDNAETAKAFKNCLKRSRETRTALRDQYQAYINPIRQKIGLPPLEWIRRR